MAGSDILPESEQPTREERSGMSGHRSVVSRYQQEADEVKPVEPVEQTKGGTAGSEGGEESGTSPIAGMFGQDEPGKGPKPPFTMKGNIYAPVPGQEAAYKQQLEKNIFEAEQRANIADYQAAGYSEKTMLDMVAIGERDAVTARQLHDTHFAKATQRMNQLYQKVDEASSLKVNPYNWSESIGRGGRVSAAFAVLTGQMAAGAGNPNSALNMMDAAIERDIAAQQQNIKNRYEAIRISRGLGQDDRALYQEELASLNETRAIAYSALQGRISAAKQHAINAAHYESIGVADDHYNLAKVNAIQAARQNIHIEVDGHVNAATQQMMLQEIAEMEKGFMKPQTSREAVEAQHEQAVQSQGQAANTVAQGALDKNAPTAPGRAGAVAGRRGPKTKTGGTPPEAGTSQEQAAGQSLPQGREDEDLGMSVSTAPEKAPQKTTGAGKPAARQRQVFTRQESAKALRSAGVPEEVVKNDGYGVAYRLKQGEGSAKTTTITQAVNAINNNELIPNGGLLLNRDADYVQQHILPPDPSQYAAGVDGAAYKAAQSLYEYGQEYEEIYETRATVGGQRNTIVAGGMTFKLAEGAPERGTTPDARRAYMEMQGKLGESATGMRTARALAKQIRSHGLAGIFTPEGGINIPGINTDDPATLKLTERMITQGMQYIKKHDPTARISDQDLKVGREATSGYDTKTGRVIDFLQSLDGESKNNAKRRQIERFIVASVIEAQRLMYEKYENSLVPSYNTMTRTNEEINEMQLWIDTQGAKNESGI